MRNPNGYGGVVDLGKHRRNRYAVRITDKIRSSISDNDGVFRQKYTYIGYYNTLRAAKQALAEYNAQRDDNYINNYEGITFAEVWQKHCEQYLQDTTTSRYRSYTAAFNKCKPLHDMRMSKIRLKELQDVADSYKGWSKSCLNNIKIVMNFVFEWCLKNDVVSKNYAVYVDISPRQVEGHSAFTQDEVARLWQNKSNGFNALYLIYIYTGCRPSELLELTRDNIFIKDQYFKITKAKTAAGVRAVPIADKILPLFKAFLQEPPNTKNNFINLSYAKYADTFKKDFATHRPHDTRVTFTTLMMSAEVPEVITKKIVGHTSNDITRDVYTKFEVKTLLNAVNKI